MGDGDRAHWDKRLLPTVELAMNATPSVVTGFRPFDLVFVHHPDVAHALFDSADHPGVSSFPERLAMADERLHDAHIAIHAARLEQKRRYDKRRQPIPPLMVGDEVYIRLRDRPVPGLLTGKLDPRKAGPFRVSEILSPHRVRLDLGADSTIGDEFSVEQLDACPRSPDPFAYDRDEPGLPAVPALHDEEDIPSAPLHQDDVGTLEGGEPVADGEYLPDDADPTTSRTRRVPDHLRGFQVGVAAIAGNDAFREALHGPIYRSRVMEVDGVNMELRERPVAFLSRLTSSTEKKMVASELELCCLTWAFARFAHWLEGAPVTVVTDHSPLGPMLSSTTPIPYGPTIARCRALLLPHMTNLRFVHRAGSRHTNADALSRLPPAPP